MASELTALFLRYFLFHHGDFYMSDVILNQTQSTESTTSLVRQVLNNFFKMFSVVSANDQNYFTYAGVGSVMGFVHHNLKDKVESQSKADLSSKDF